jgi:hypothetical protein
MNSSISFRCHSCRARIKAPVQLVGQTRACPSCGHNIVIHKVIPPDQDPILVLEDTGAFLRLQPRFSALAWA